MTATCQGQTAAHTRHDRLMRTKLRPDSEEHTHARAPTSTSYVNQCVCVCYLRDRSSDRPEKSKKFRYSDATNWLNSLLQRDRKHQNSTEYVQREINTGHVDPAMV